MVSRHQHNQPFLTMVMFTNGQLLFLSFPELSLLFMHFQICTYDTLQITVLEKIYSISNFSFRAISLVLKTHESILPIIFN
jgi:hypothetical protein